MDTCHVGSALWSLVAIKLTLMKSFNVYCFTPKKKNKKAAWGGYSLSTWWWLLPQDITFYVHVHPCVHSIYVHTSMCFLNDPLEQNVSYVSAAFISFTFLHNICTRHFHVTCLYDFFYFFFVLHDCCAV